MIAIVSIMGGKTTHVICLQESLLLMLWTDYWELHQRLCSSTHRSWKHLFFNYYLIFFLHFFVIICLFIWKIIFKMYRGFHTKSKVFFIHRVEAHSNTFFCYRYLNVYCWRNSILFPTQLYSLLKQGIYVLIKYVSG